jgi:putative redox protein
VKIVARRRSGFTHDVEIESGHTLVFDEPEAAGGGDQGPTPAQTVAAALAACTAITCEMYAARKGWELGAVEVDVDATFGKNSSIEALEVTLRIPQPLDEEQQERLLVIAGKCPVHRALTGQVPVEVVDRIECQVPPG